MAGQGDHKRSIIGLSFSSNGAYLASMGYDNNRSIAIYRWASNKSTEQMKAAAELQSCRAAKPQSRNAAKPQSCKAAKLQTYQLHGMSDKLQATRDTRHATRDKGDRHDRPGVTRL